MIDTKKTTHSRSLPEYMSYGLGIGYSTADTVFGEGMTSCIVECTTRVTTVSGIQKKRCAEDIQTYLSYLADHAVYQTFWEEHLVSVPNIQMITIDKEGVYDLGITSQNSSEGVLFVRVKQGCAVQIHERLCSRDILRLIVHIEIEQGASVEYVSVPEKEHQGVLFVHRTFVTHKASSVTVVDGVPQKKLGKTSILSCLVGAQASSGVYGVTYGKGNAVSDVFHQTTHLRESTSSHMHTESVLDQHAHTIYRSLIDIQDNAVQAKGHQTQHTTLLSGSAKIQSIPNLTVSQKDVECTHGVSMSQPDEEAVFYLSSRGISEENARQQLIVARCNTILSYISDPTIREEILSYVESLTI